MRIIADASGVHRRRMCASGVQQRELRDENEVREIGHKPMHAIHVDKKLIRITDIVEYIQIKIRTLLIMKRRAIE